ncbi:MAG: conjugal transfer protein TraR [Pseudomonadota bacterium]
MDEADISDERIEIARQWGLHQAQLKAASITVGMPGECDKCGEDRPRLVNGWCCFCRDKFKV